MRSHPVREAMLQDLKRSGLTEADAKLLRMEPRTKQQSTQLAITHHADGYLIPYFGVDGKVTEFYRYRLLEDARTGFEKVSGVKPLKYVQPSKTINEVYLPPYIKWREVLQDDGPILITEGEKKAAAGCKVGIPTIGLGGVWNFQSAKNKLALLPGLEQFNWKRSVWIVYDSDAAANAQVRMAAARLAECLVAKGAEVHVGYWPAPSVDKKVGLDDYLLAHTPEELREYLNDHVPTLASCVALHQMNELVTYVVDPGLIYLNGTGQRVSPRNFKDHTYSHFSFIQYQEKKEGPPKPIKIKTAAAWLDWPQRAQVRRLVYEPGQPEYVDGCINLWKSYPTPPAKGDIRPWKELLDFIFAGAPAEREWFERWCAYPFQHPGTKMRTAVLLWGRYRGTGKSQIGFTLGDLYGENYTLIGDQELENQDNDWAFNKQFVVGDEITGQNNRKLANALKTMITREQITINQKYVPRFVIRDCINYLFTSNDPDAFYLDVHERRYFIHEVTGAPLSEEFYKKYHDWRLSKEGRAALLYHLSTLPLGDFNPMAPAPHTKAKEQMVALTRTELEAYLVDVMQNPDDHLKRYGGGDLTTLTEIGAGYDSGDGKRVSSVLLSRKLKQVGLEALVPPGTSTSQVRLSNSQRVVFYALKNKTKWAQASGDELRTHYEKHRSLKK